MMWNILQITCIVGCVLGLFVQYALGQFIYLTYSFEGLRRLYLAQVLLLLCLTFETLALYVVTRNMVFIGFCFAYAIVGGFNLARTHKIYTILRCTKCRDVRDDSNNRT